MGNMKRQRHRSKKAQLFVIEVIFSVALLLALTIFIFTVSTQQQETTTTNESMKGISKQVYASLKDMRENLVLDHYIEKANTSFYTTSQFLDNANPQKLAVEETLQSTLTNNYMFRATLFRNDNNQWRIIDMIHETQQPPQGARTITVEYFVNTVFDVGAPSYAIEDSFRLSIIIWEVV